MQIPIFLFTGFLDSGKTTFIKETLMDPEFTRGLKTLLILAEDGEEEFDDAFLEKIHVKKVELEEEEDFTDAYLELLKNQYHPDQILLEWNGMWRMDTVYERNLPDGWMIAQVINTINSQTFEMYLGNSTSGLIMEPVKTSEIVLFNRCKEETPKANYRRMVKAVNRAAQVIFEREDGSIDNNVEDVLPFDLSKNEIVIEDEDYGIWYMDAMEHPEKYDGKIVDFRALVYRPKKFLNRLPKNCIIAGRHAMTCCADDVTFIGMKCITKDADQMNHRDWIRLRARIKKEFAREYQGDGPVLYAEGYLPAERPQDDLVYFN